MTPWQWLLWCLCLGLELAALVLAALLARRDRSHRPVATLFAFAVVQAVALRVLQVLVLEPAPKPLSASWLAGTLSWGQRLTYHADTMLFASWPPACAALAWWNFCGPRKAEGPAANPGASGVGRNPARAANMGSGGIAVKLLLAAWLLLAASLAFWFPLPRGWTSPVLNVWCAAMAAISAPAVALGWERRREPAAIVASWLLAAQVAVAIIGPFAFGRPWEVDGDWRVARWVYIAIFSLFVLRHVLWLRSRQ